MQTLLEKARSSKTSIAIGVATALVAGTAALAHVPSDSVPKNIVQEAPQSVEVPTAAPIAPVIQDSQKKIENLPTTENTEAAPAPIHENPQPIPAKPAEAAQKEVAPPAPVQVPAVKSAEQQPDPKLSPSCSCPAADLDCSDFSSHDEAQAVYECCYDVHGYDYHRLDRDSDGLACEAS